MGAGDGHAFGVGGSAGDDVHTGIAGTSYGFLDDGVDLGVLDDLLRTGEAASTIGSLPSAIVDTVALTGLVVGQSYEIQLFFMDQRNSLSSPPNSCVGCADRVVTFVSGPNSVTLDADPGNTLGAPYGQFVLGTFMADSTTQTFDVSGGTPFDVFWNAPVSNRQVNAWQLRAVPEPSLAGLLGAAFVGALVQTRRRKI